MYPKNFEKRFINHEEKDMENISVGCEVLKGEVEVPPSKSIAHRAIIAAALSGEKCVIHNAADSNDIMATLSCMRALGTKYLMNTQKKQLVLEPKKTYKAPKELVLDCAESGSTLRFLMPLALLVAESVKFTGRGRLLQRPQKPYFDLFDEKNISYEKGGDYIKISGKLTAGKFMLPGDISSQFITGLMFALPLLQGDSEIILSTELESKGYVDLTMDVLKKFGIEIICEDYKKFSIKGSQKYRAADVTVEGDYSQAAFFLVAGAIGCDVTCKNLRSDSLQGDKKILEIIEEAGGKIEYTADGGIRARYTALMHGICIDARDIPDLVPILAVLCAFCKGESRIINAGRLRYKESDRLAAVSSELKRLGVDVIEGSDYLRITGRDLVTGTTTSAWNDHRIAMAIAVAAVRCEGEVTIVGAKEAVKKSYPDFFEVYKGLAKNGHRS